MGKMINIENIPCYEPVEINNNVKGGLIVIHEVWGLTDHIKDVADRFAEQGYYVLAPNLLDQTEIEKIATPEFQKSLFDPEKRNTIQPKLREMMAPLQLPEFAEQTNTKVEKIFEYLYQIDTLDKKVAVNGFCFGGTYSYNLAVDEPRLKAAVPFYGHSDQSVEELSRIQCPILAFYGETDESLVSHLDDLKARMKEANVSYQSYVYPDCGHAFFNDSNLFAYNQVAANDAWQKTTQFLDDIFNK